MNDAPYKIEDDIYEELKSIKDLIKRRHTASECKFISIPITRLDNEKANTIVKRYVD